MKLKSIIFSLTSICAYTVIVATPFIINYALNNKNGETDPYKNQRKDGFVLLNYQVESCSKIQFVSTKSKDIYSLQLFSTINNEAKIYANYNNVEDEYFEQFNISGNDYSYLSVTKDVSNKDCLSIKNNNHSGLNQNIVLYITISSSSDQSKSTNFQISVSAEKL
jgi:hypothetical protein